MRLLAAADIHGFDNVYEWLAAEARTRQVDAMILAGDLLGVPDGFPTVEDAMQASAERIGAILDTFGFPVLYIMGNDDLIDLGAATESRISIHDRRVDMCGFAFVGYQCGPPFMRGPFERQQDELERELTSLLCMIDDQTVLVTHYPAAGILDNGFGLPAIRHVIDCSSCFAHIHGHSHGRFGREGRHFNVASAGKFRAMVIDLEDRTYQVVDDQSQNLELSW